ncbi:MAG: glycosyltransferase family 4 protein [Acidobacteria bacterium]|nr:glycosyltransferase family 4 protein [Acidobacteriota bacterium]
MSRLPGIEIKVLAPVPYFPNLKISHRWQFSQVANREVIEGLDVRHPRYFLTPKIGMPLYGYFMAASLLPAVKKLRKEFDFDVIDSHYVYPDGFASAIIGKDVKKPVIITARGSDINLFQCFRTIRPLLTRCLNKADRVVTVSRALKDSILDLKVPSEKIHVIPNGVDSKKFHPIPQTEARKALGLPIEKKIILSVGGLVELKGFDILIRAMRILRDVHERQDLYLVIAGYGKEQSRLEKLIRSMNLTASVRLVGVMPHQKLFQLYSAADLFCLASSREGWPNVILESLACGTPVIATNVGGIPEIIRSDRVGLLCERNENSFAETILSALSKSWEYEEIIRSADGHSWDRAAQSVYNVLETAVVSYKEKQLSRVP